MPSAPIAPHPDESAEALATLTLSALRGLSQSQALALVAHYGTAAAALADTSPTHSQWAALRADTAALHQAQARAEAEMDFCQQHHIQVIPTTSANYPTRLLEPKVTDRPLQLFYCGTGTLNRRHILSVVGTRHVTEYGKQMCESLLRDLALLVPDVLIISGLAYGIDIHAHRAALESHLPTAAVLAHGLDRIYPRLHRDTASQMTHNGGLITEYFTGTSPDRGRFIQRNRIVAGLSSATLVVESAHHGGSLVTARIARTYGRPVMAVPGRTTDPASEGCNRLIADRQAELVTSASDIVRLLKWQPAPAPAEPQLFTSYKPLEQLVVDALGTADSLSSDQISYQTGLAPAALTDVLFDLEDLNAIKRLPGNRFRLKN